MAGGIPRGVVALGFVSLFMDVSSEMIHGLLPLFLTGTLGASALILGLVEGVAEAAAQITKVFSGVLSDRFGRRKPLAVLGYGFSPSPWPPGWCWARVSSTGWERAFAVRRATRWSPI